ncbi:MAG: cation transporter, partial [Actinomycetota bacterium]|nr:cation transporter [Actinomycetota bacterium]
MGQSAAPLGRPGQDSPPPPGVRSAGAAEAREAALADGFRLEFFSVGWNVLEVAVGMVAGIAAGSVALVGFALDSVAEASSAAVLLWRIRAERGSGRTAEDLEKKAVRLVAIAFFGLAGYVGVRAIWDLATRSRPEESLPGIVLALVSLIVMPILARHKGRVARKLDSRSLQADSRQTVL